MDAKETNKQLDKLYYGLPILAMIPVVGPIITPFILAASMIRKCTESYTRKDNLRIQFVVKEENQLTKFSKAKQKNKYIDFMNNVNSNINPKMEDSYFCTDIIKDKDSNDSKSMSQNIEILREETKIMKPKFIIFMTGKSNDKYIDELYGERLFYIPNKEDTDVAFVRSMSYDIKNIVLRVPMLDRLSEEKIEKHADTVTRIILNSSLSYYKKLKDYESKH